MLNPLCATCKKNLVKISEKLLCFFFFVYTQRVCLGRKTETTWWVENSKLSAVS